MDHWRHRDGGRGHVIGILADPGIGKSRLLYEARRQIAREPHVWIEGGGAQIFRNTPFYVITQMIKLMLNRHRTLSPSEYLAPLEGSLALAGVHVEEAGPLIADLLGLPAKDQRGAPTMSGDQRRADLVRVLATWLLNTARRWPTVLAIEDVHWIDPSSMELLSQLVDQAAEAGLFVIYTSRIRHGTPWRSGKDHTHILLPRLDPASVRSLVVDAADGALAADLVEKVMARADGVPLFAEELTRLIVERGDQAGDREIPSSISALLMARLDQLGQAREIAQIASVLGHDIQHRLLEAVSDVEDGALHASLETLIQADILSESGPQSDRTYTFRHSLIQDAAYEALLRSRRRVLHRRAAMIITEQFKDIATSQPEVLAQHWAGADEPWLAIAEWRRAGGAATARRAFSEAQTAYEQAIAIVETMPPSPERAAQELALHSSLAGVLQITRGFSATETIAATLRARLLAEAGGDLSQQLRQVSGQWAAASSAGDYEQAGPLAETYLQLARAQGRPANLGQAHMIQMTSLYRSGALLEAEQYFRDGEQYFHLPAFFQRPGAARQVYGNAAVLARIMGDEREGIRRIERALTISAENNNPYDLAFAQGMAGVVSILARDFGAAETWARNAFALTQEHGFPQFAPMCQLVLGRARAAAGQVEEGLGLIREGLLGLDEARARSGRTDYLCWLSETQALAGAVGDAIATMEEALSLYPLEVFCRAECLRLRGEWMMRLGQVEEARADFLEAIAVSRKMGAKLFHARASASLQRLTPLRAGP